MHNSEQDGLNETEMERCATEGWVFKEDLGIGSNALGVQLLHLLILVQ